MILPFDLPPPPPTHLPSSLRCHSGGYLGLDAEFPERVKAVSVVQELKEHSFTLPNGEEYNIDSILLCTGYKYSFPFLPERYQPMTSAWSEDEQFQRLSRLYKMTVHVDDPTLLFVGMTKYAANFPFYHFQSHFAAAILLGKVSLPDKPWWPMLSNTLRTNGSWEFFQRIIIILSRCSTS